MEDINSNEVTKRFKLITNKMKKHAKVVRRKKDHERQKVRQIERKERRREKKYVKDGKSYLGKSRKSNRRYFVQKQLGTLESFQRTEHPISRFSQVRAKYQNIKHGREMENVNVENRDRDKFTAVVKLGENAILHPNRDDPEKTEPTFEIPLNENLIELDEDDLFSNTNQLTQSDLSKEFDLNTQKKIFNIELNHQGGFHIEYTTSGRHVLLGGFKGQLCSFDWRGFKPKFEVGNLGFGIESVRWMMDDSLLAVACKRSKTRVYSDKGELIHCLKDFIDVNFIEYLPYHFLLVGGSGERGTIHFKDISIGTTVASVEMPKFSSFTQNPNNALIICGHVDGTVSMVSPRDAKNEPVVSMFCHKSAIAGIICDYDGKYLTTAGEDGVLKTWDIRNTFSAICEKKISGKVSPSMAVSQKGILAYSINERVCVVKHMARLNEEVYLNHSVPDGVVTSLNFCPFEDVLGVGWTRGFSSVVIPGCGSLQFDSRNPNPYFNDRTIKNWNVDRLLEKIPFDMICLDPNFIGSSGKMKSNQLKLDPNLKEKVKELDYRIKPTAAEIEDGDEFKMNDDFYSLSRDKRRKVLGRHSKKMPVVKKWFEESNPDPLNRFLSKSEMLKRQEEEKEEEKEKKRVEKRKRDAENEIEGEPSKKKQKVDGEVNEE